MTQFHSTGRGGAGNIGEDNTVYVDSGVVREGVAGESIDGAYSSGRGGAGNVGGTPKGTPKLNPQHDGGRRGSQDIIPETNLRPQQENFHTGRGGQGNVHKEKYGGHSAPQDGHKESFVHKIKDTLGLDGKHQS